MKIRRCSQNLISAVDPEFRRRHEMAINSYSSIYVYNMDDSEKSKIFAFGQLENPEVSVSEESLTDSSSDDYEDAISKNEVASTSSKTNESDLDLVKQMQELTRKILPSSSTSDSNDFFKRRMMDYNDESFTDDDYTRLPSEITDKEYIYMPPISEEIDDDEDMNTSGKWMIFPHGDLQKLDRFWLDLIPLYKNGTLTRLKCSTSMGSAGGVINCYTADSEDIADVMKAADAIRECVDYDTIMYYKTNEATARGLYARYGSKNISKYMHTVNGCLYEKDRFERWRLVTL